MRQGGHRTRRQGNDEERERLRQGVKRVGPDTRAVALAEGLLEGLRVEVKAVLLAGEGGDGADSASSLASELSTLLVGLLVVLVLENDDAQTDVAGGHEERDASETNETDLPDEDKTEDDTENERRDGLDDRAEGDTGKTIDLLRTVGEVRHERAGVVLVAVEVLDVLA